MDDNSNQVIQNPGPDAIEENEKKLGISPAGSTFKPQSSPLVSIPLEVLLQISAHLTTPDLGAFRLTCKEIEGSLLKSFAKEFFTKRQFMFTEFSLQALVDISESRFASSLTQLIFGLEQPHPRYSFGIPHINNLLSTDQDITLLTEAFKNLGNLVTIGIRDFNARSRNRDYPNNTWKSYGATAYDQDSGSRLYVATHALIGGRTFLGRVLLNTLFAAGQASLLPRNFEVILRHSSVRNDDLAIPSHMAAIVEPVLENLRTLFLDVGVQPSVYLDPNHPTEAKYPTLRFLSKTTALDHLRLNFKDCSWTDRDGTLSWLSQPHAIAASPSTTTPLDDRPNSPEYKNLTRLDIGMVTIEPRIILDIIRKHRATLRTISLHKVAFVHKDGVPAADRDNLWAKFFSKLSGLDLALNGINMSFLSQQQPARQHVRHVSFKNSTPAHTKTWATTDTHMTQSALRDFKELVEVKGLKYDTEVESEESDDSDAYDSMDDEDDDDDEVDEDQEDGDGDGDGDVEV